MYGYHWEKIDVGHYWDLQVKQRRRRRQQERQKTIGSEIGKTTTCITLFSTFLCRRCMTTTWVLNVTFCRERDARRLPFSFSELRYSPLELNSRKIRTHLTNWTRWNKRDKVWSSANSLFIWRFRSRSRRYCLSSLMLLLPLRYTGPCEFVAAVGSNLIWDRRISNSLRMCENGVKNRIRPWNHSLFSHPF